MVELQPAQFVPPVDADEDALNQVINNGIRTEFHPSGTLAMLPLEQGGVVDSHLRVWGMFRSLLFFVVTNLGRKTYLGDTMLVLLPYILPFRASKKPC